MQGILTSCQLMSNSKQHLPLISALSSIEGSVFVTMVCLVVSHVTHNRYTLIVPATTTKVNDFSLKNTKYPFILLVAKFQTRPKIRVTTTQGRTC